MSEWPEVIRFDERRGPRGFELLSLRELYSRNLDELYRPHRLAFCSITIVTAGRLSPTLDFRSHALGVGDILVVAPGQLFSHDPDADVDADHIVFRPEFAFVQHSAAAISAVPVLGVGGAVVHLDDDTRDEFGRITQAMRTEQERPGDDWRDDMLRVLLRQATLLIERAAANTTTHGERDEQRRFALLVAQIDAELASTRAVAFHARRQGTTPEALNRLTQQVANRTCKAVIDERAVLELKRRLVHGAEPVKAIAAALGFSDPTNLVKFFRRHTGETPEAFRQRHRWR